MDIHSIRGPLSLKSIWKAPLHQSPSGPLRFLIRSTLSLAGRKLVSCQGVEHIQPDHDPFILVLNHSQKLEAIYIPALLYYLRGGRVVHFLADWNFCLVPGVWFFYHYGQVITVSRKPAKPKFLNVFKPLFTSRQSSVSRARKTLEAGKSIGIFPEGTTNRHPTKLLKGYTGAAQLSLKTGIPVVTAGLTFPSKEGYMKIPEGVPFSVKFSAPIQPPRLPHDIGLKDIHQHHATIMQRLASLSQKTWTASEPRRP